MKLVEVLHELEEGGIYALETNKHLYIILKGTENSYENIDYELNEDILKIKFDTDALSERKQIVYEVEPFPTDIYDTLVLEQDGEEIGFNSIYGK
ncbi:hypothetical protein [Desulfonispora thiosulfatigenes]|nr:hypothetical protein [Desulfonispora thiosulfatigenes]